MITDEAQLRAIYGHAAGLAVDKQTAGIDDSTAAYLARSPFALIATSSADGRVDVSPKGDAPGFAQPDGGAVLIPDWPGNNRLDGYVNILSNPHAGLIFMIPGLRETLRINGRASIHDDAALRARFETRGRLPITVLRIEADEVFLHCAKAFLRSRLWDPATWPAKADLPNAGEMIMAHAKMPKDTAVEPEEEKYARYGKTLY